MAWMTKWQAQLEGPFHGMLGYLNYSAAADFGKRMDDILNGMSNSAKQALAKKIRDSLSGGGYWKGH